jgi:hypothetical protein
MRHEDLMRQFASLVGRALARRWLQRLEAAHPMSGESSRSNGADLVADSHDAPSVSSDTAAQGDSMVFDYRP